jgi:cytidylate kinase
MEQLIADIALRDKKDSEREVSPLKQAEDAVLIDTSSLTFDEVVENLFMRIKK